MIIGTIFTALAIPVWWGLYAVYDIDGFALASTLVMTGYAAGMAIAWARDSGWDAVRALLPSLARGLVAAVVAGLAGWPVVSGLLGNGELTVLAGVGSAALGGITVIAAFLGASYFLRSPELSDITRRAKTSQV